MGIFALIGCACPARLDMIGFLGLLDMAVMMGHCALRQKRETRSTRHVSMTETQTSRQSGQQAGRPTSVAGGYNIHMGRLARDFST